MSMLSNTQNSVSYGKVGLYGGSGSGKTRTAAEIAIGLYKFAKLDKPVCMFDTEPAAFFIKPLFVKAGIDFRVYDKSRSFTDMLAFCYEAEKDGSIIIVDSITHVWRDLQESFMKRLNATRKQYNKKPLSSLEFQHWRPIKSEWGQFTDFFISSKVHFILCGRAGTEYAYQLNETNNKMELISKGNKMATEKELAHEPSLLIEMVKHRDDNRIINQAFVEKDRADIYNGKKIDYPKFESFKKHFEFLNIGGDHFDSMEQNDSAERFTIDGEDNWSYEKRQREIYCEEIKSLFVTAHMDGTGKDEKIKRNNMLNEIFGTGSWTKIQNMNSDVIQNGYHNMKSIIKPETMPNLDDVPQ